MPQNVFPATPHLGCVSQAKQLVTVFPAKGAGGRRRNWPFLIFLCGAAFGEVLEWVWDLFTPHWHRSRAAPVGQGPHPGEWAWGCHHSWELLRALTEHFSSKR